MRHKKFLTGLVTPQVLSAAESDPNGSVLKELRTCGCLEIRYDLFTATEDWALLAERVERLHPAALRLATVRLRRDGGAFDDSRASMRLPLWGALCEAATPPHWFDLELECVSDFEALRALAAGCGARVLLSQHHFDGIPAEGELASFAQQCRQLGAAGFKIACMSHVTGDTAGLYSFIRKEAPHFELFSAFAMGSTGQVSRIWSLACGANLTYGAIGEVQAPGQIQVGEMHRIIERLDSFEDEGEVMRLLETGA